MLLKINNISKKYGDKTTFENISFEINHGEIFSLVGKSGVGKSTIARIILGIEKASSGSIEFNGQDISKRDIKDIQMIFQDPYSALNEAFTIEETLREILKVNKENNIESRINEMLEYTSLTKYKDKVPSELSGGQRQRVLVAAAMILKPKLVICDEAIASLDLTIQEQIINLILFFNKEYKTSFLFISHNMSIVKNISNRIFNLEVK